MATARALSAGSFIIIVVIIWALTLARCACPFVFVTRLLGFRLSVVSWLLAVGYCRVVFVHPSCYSCCCCVPVAVCGRLVELLDNARLQSVRKLQKQKQKLYLYYHPYPISDITPIEKHRSKNCNAPHAHAPLCASCLQVYV